MLGWIVAAALGIGLLVVLAVAAHQRSAVDQVVPSIKSIVFYDEA